MAIRDRLRRRFGSKKNGSNDSTPGSNSPPKRSDIEYYKPHEIPKSKYRGKVDKAHQDRLEAYSLGDAFNVVRRKSSQALSGTFSPGGTQSQSRRASWISRGKSTLSTDNGGSDIDSKSLRRKSVASAGAPKEETVAEDDEDVNNGISRTATEPDGPERQFLSNGQTDIPQIRLEKTITAGRPISPSSPNGSPFTLEQLEQAMSRSTLRPRRETAIAPVLPAEGVAA